MNGEWYTQALAVATAVACGLLIGIERGFNLRHAGDGTRVAGVRTFTLLGVVSGIAGVIAGQSQALAAGALIAGAAAVLAIGYAHRPELRKKPDATSPIAAISTLALGFLAGSGNPGLAITGATLVTLVLALREEAHGLVNRLDEEDVKALARFASQARLQSQRPRRSKYIAYESPRQDSLPKKTGRGAEMFSGRQHICTQSMRGDGIGNNTDNREGRGKASVPRITFQSGKTPNRHPGPASSQCRLETPSAHPNGQILWNSRGL